MTIFSAVKKGFAISAKALSVLLVLFVYNVVINFAIRPIQGTQPAAWGPDKWATAIGVMLVAILAGLFFQGGMLGFIADAVKQGSSSLAAFFSSGAKYFGRLFGLAAILFLIFGLAAIVIAVLFGLAGVLGKDNAAIMTVGVIIVLIPAAVALYYLVLLSYSPIVLVAQDLKIFEAMRQSMNFVKKNILKIIGLGLVLFIIAFLAGLLVGILAGLVTFALDVNARNTILVIVGSAVNSYFNIVLTSGLVSFYLAITAASSKTQEAAPAQA